MLVTADLFQAIVEWTDSRCVQVFNFILETLQLIHKHLLAFL